MAGRDLFVERLSRQQGAARARAERLRAFLPELASRLYAAGATRVVAFGSLATGKEPHMGTDIDLATEGLGESALGEIALELLGEVPARVDLVRLEDASDSLRRRISREGEELPRVPR